jgi:phosphohistidine phosphatase
MPFATPGACPGSRTPRMLLALIRHGIAEDAGPAAGYRDDQRRLTPDGANRIRASAAGIALLGIRPAAVLTSPLIRCVQTAQIVADRIGADVRPHDLLRPGARGDGLLEVLAEYPEAACVLVCGHQPDLSYITQTLTGGMVDYRRGTLGLIELSALQPNHGTLVGLYPAKVLRRMATSP